LRGAAAASPDLPGAASVSIDDAEKRKPFIFIMPPVLIAGVVAVLGLFAIVVASVFLATRGSGDPDDDVQLGLAQPNTPTHAATGQDGAVTDPQPGPADKPEPPDQTHETVDPPKDPGGTVDPEPSQDPGPDPSKDPETDPGVQIDPDPDLEKDPPNRPPVNPDPDPTIDRPIVSPINPRPDPRVDTGPSPADLAKLGQLLTDARAALGHRRLGEAAVKLNEAESLAKTPAHKEMVQRLKTLSNYVNQFWNAFNEGLRGLESGNELVVGNKRVSIVSVTPETLTYRISGGNRTQRVDELSPEAVLVIADHWFDQTAATTNVFKGAYLAVHPGGKIEEARRLWRQAQLRGADIGSLMPVLDDSYNLAPN